MRHTRTASRRLAHASAWQELRARPGVVPAMGQPPLDQLAPHVTSLHACGAPGYDDARERAIWNKRLDKVRAPDAIVGCASPAEVAAAIRFAAANGLTVSPRGSGHHYDAAALRDGGLMLDLG